MDFATFLRTMPTQVENWRSGRRLKVGDKFDTQFATWQIVHVRRRARTTGTIRMRHTGRYDLRRVEKGVR